MTRPTSGTAIDVEGTISATISWKTLRDRSIVIPAQHSRRNNNNNNNNNNNTEDNLYGAVIMI